jgi:hypothetical protein
MLDTQSLVGSSSFSNTDLASESKVLQSISYFTERVGRLAFEGEMLDILYLYKNEWEFRCLDEPISVKSREIEMTDYSKKQKY